MIEQKLEPGMLILGGLLGKPGEKLDRVWAVKSVTPSGRATLLCHVDYASVEAKGKDLPEGWRIINGSALAQRLVEECKAVSEGRWITGLTGAGKLALELQGRIDGAKEALERGFPKGSANEVRPGLRPRRSRAAESLAVGEALRHLDTSGIEL